MRSPRFARTARVVRTLALLGSIALAAACGGATGGAGVESPGAGGGMMSPSGMHDGGMHDGGATDGGAAGSDCRTVEGGTVTLVAEGLAFDADCIAAPADTAFVLTLENRDGAPHNVTIEDASGTVVFDGENVTQDSIDYDVPALAAGEYPFHCHVHPDMRGVLRIG